MYDWLWLVIGKLEMIQQKYQMKEELNKWLHENYSGNQTIYNKPPNIIRNIEERHKTLNNTQPWHVNMNI